MEVRLITPGEAPASDKRAWDEFVNANEFSTVYHTWAWGEVLGSSFGYRGYYLCFFEGGEMVASIPTIYIRSPISGAGLKSLPMCEYGGPLLGQRPDGHTPELVVEKMLELAHLLGAEYVEVRSPLDPRITKALVEKGFRRLRTYTTFRIDLSKGVKALWRSLNKKVRNAVRKALKSGLEVVEARGKACLRAFYRLSLLVDKRHGSPAHPFRFFEDLSSCMGREKARFLLSLHDGRPVGGILLLRHKNKLYWRAGVMDDRFRHLNPTNLLLWKAIEMGAEEGLEELDLGRTRKGTGIYLFKSRWGGREALLRDYVLFLRRPRELPEPYHRRYVYLSKIWSLVPSSLNSKIGWRLLRSVGF